MRKEIRRGLAFLLVKVLILLTRIVKRRVGIAIFAFLGRLAFNFFRKDRNITLRNISKAFPKADSIVTRAMAVGCFKWMGRNTYDALRLNYISPEEVLSLCVIDDEDNLRVPYREGSGVIALTGHIGNWELLAAYMSHRGYKVSVIGRKLHDGRLNRLLLDIRQKHGVDSIPHSSNVVSVYSVLERGEILCMPLDQDIEGDGILFPFFGHLVHTPKGLATFAIKSGAAVVPMAVHMRHNRRHRITILPKLDFPSPDLPIEERIIELTSRCSTAVETLIRIHPQQWVWFHDRWKTHSLGERDAERLGKDGLVDMHLN